MLNSALHPYYKLTYIEHVWGGAKEQEAEQEAGKLDAKNWQDEAQKVLEQTVHVLCCILLVLMPSLVTDTMLLEGTHRNTKCNT